MLNQLIVLIDIKLYINDLHYLSCKLDSFTFGF